MAEEKCLSSMDYFILIVNGLHNKTTLKQRLVLTLANKAYADNYVRSANTITDYVAKNWWKKKGIAKPEGITEFYKVPQVVWNMQFDKFTEDLIIMHNIKTRNIFSR